MLNNNPFGSKQASSEKISIDICSSKYDLGNKEKEKISGKDKSVLILNAIKSRFKDATKKAVEKVTNPIVSESQKVSTFFLAEKKSICGDMNSDVYMLLNLLSSKDSKVSLKASRRLELKLNEPASRQIVFNYFKNNSASKSKFPRLYRALCEFES